MATNQDRAERWATYWATSAHAPEPLRSRGTVFTDGGRELYSYGHHFTLAEYIGERGQGFFLLNGDRYSVTTSGHQSLTRSAIPSWAQSLIVPASALAAAGVIVDTIRPLEILEDRVEHWSEDCGEAWDIDDPRAVARWDVAQDSEYPFPSYLHGLPGRVGREWHVRGSNVHAVELLRGHDYGRGDYVNYRPGERVSFYDTAGNSVETTHDGRFTVGRSRHWLGASLFSARVHGRKERCKFLSGFDQNEARPLYFLALLPRCTARTVDEALHALAPRAVHAAHAQSRDVVRQGDVFAIATSLDTRTVTRRALRKEKRGKLLGTEHVATEVAYCRRGVTYARGTMTHAPAFRARDHARRKMGDGKTWYLIVRNTVPRQRATAPRAAARW